MKKIEEYVRSIPDFPEPGIIFRDVTSILQDADGLKLAIDSMQDCLKDVDVDVQIAVLQRGCDTETVKFKEVEAFLAAVLTYEGRYELITQINETIANWV